MGDGKKLKEILEQKGKNVHWVAKESNISPTTIYSIITRDTSIRFDFALRIANVLGIEPSEICSDTTFFADGNDINEVLSIFPTGISNLLSKMSHDEIYAVGELLTDYYQLTDEGREDVMKYIEEKCILDKIKTECANCKKYRKVKTDLM